MLIFSVKCLILHLFLDPITAKRKSMNTSNHAQINISNNPHLDMHLHLLDNLTGHPTNCTNEGKGWTGWISARDK